MSAVLFIVGVISIAAQVVLLRELDVAAFGVELVYILGLGAWLAATALGTLLCPSPRIARTGLVALPLFLFSLLVPLAVATARGSRILLGAVPGAYLPFGGQVVTILLTLLPAGFLSGWLFRRAAGLFVTEGRTVAAAYAIESAGGVAGGLLSSLGLYAGFQNFSLAVACSLVAAAASALPASGGRRSRRRIAAFGLGGAFLLGLFLAPTLDRAMTRWDHPSLIESRDTPYGRVSITQREAQVSVFLNNALAFETEGTEAEHFVHLAALQHPGPERILILGGGIGGTAAEALRHGPAHVDCVEVDAALTETVRTHLPPPRRAPLENPAVRIVADDPRRFLQAGGTYDLILVGMPEPSSGQANRFYTREFFRLCRDRLREGGIAALRLPSSENRWTPQMTERAVSIHRALGTAFEHVLFIPGDTDVITASASPLPADPGVLIERCRDRGLRSRLISEHYLRYLLQNDRFGEVAGTLRTHAAPLNTDTRPICYQLTVLVWLSKFFPALAGLNFGRIESLAGNSVPALGAAAGLCVLLLLLARIRPAWRGALLVGLAGFVGMVLETVLILQYQTRHGVLYRDLGILITAFMLGLAAGALALAAAARGGSRYRAIGRGWGVGLVAGFAVLAALVVFQARMQGLSGLAETSGLLAAAGFLVAGVFAFAALRWPYGQERAVSPLYAADLLGGCVGSVAASLLIVPLAGMDMTAAGMAALALLALILI
ncbi:MAG: Spermidine synthase [Syntrophaceae bacterium PtaB.Bin038]|nr:MAG: Spermidine synthase [Syntrophaceae bacterium PtaB.Bin038]